MKNNYANLYLLIICGITNDIPFMNWSILKITYNIENILDLLQSDRAVLLQLSTSSIRYDHFGVIGVDVLHYYWVFYELHKFRFYKICRWKKGKKNEVHFYWSICGSYRDGSCRKDSLVKLVFEEDSRNSRFSSYSLKILSDETRENQLWYLKFLHIIILFTF